MNFFQGSEFIRQTSVLNQVRGSNLQTDVESWRLTANLPPAGVILPVLVSPSTTSSGVCSLSNKNPRMHVHAHTQMQTLQREPSEAPSRVF